MDTVSPLIKYYVFNTIFRWDCDKKDFHLKIVLNV